VGARGYLRDDAAVALVLGLGVDDVREGAASVGLDDGGTRVVAGGFYSQDHRDIYSIPVCRLWLRERSSRLLGLP
jgi:hypothetical protein